MGCGVSRPETEEVSNGRKGEFKMIIRRRSIHSGVVADSFTLDKQFLEKPACNKETRPSCCETETKEEDTKTEAKKEENRGSDERVAVRDDYLPENSILLCPGSPSFRIYCVIPEPLKNDSAAGDGFHGPVCWLPRRNCQSNANINKRVRRQEAKRGRIGRGLKNVKKLLTNPVLSLPTRLESEK